MPETPAEIAEAPICARLRTRHVMTKNGAICGSMPVNPDGPEAAAVIDALATALREAHSALDKATDWFEPACWAPKGCECELCSTFAEMSAARQSSAAALAKLETSRGVD